MTTLTWHPPVSPHGLLQEQFVSDEWMVLVCCLLLNRTTRKQVDKVLPVFVQLCPTPAQLLAVSETDLAVLIKPLGFSTRRAKTLRAMTDAYLHAAWTNVRELPGVGEYAGRAHDIFCRGVLGDDPPKDHALVAYWNFCRSLI